MRVDAFDFDLPRTLIAERPMVPRDAARLLVAGPDGPLDRRVSDLPGLLEPGDLLVFNDTRVIPARLTGLRGAAGVELTLLEAVDAVTWTAFARPAKKLRPGDRIVFAPDFTATVAIKGDDGQVTVTFDRGGDDLRAALNRFGRLPLPPYIRKGQADEADRADYQTIFAKSEGAVAAPTAGLHFTESLLERLEQAGVGRITLTLHVGAGTFLPVKVENTRDHRMHAEWGCLSAEAASAIKAAKAAGKKVVAVGTTSARLLEASGGLAFEGRTDIFLTPGSRFHVVDRLLTNFHLPRSTLFMLVAAFAGLERMHALYAHAISQGYRFYSYGDACLLSREDR